jgi:hypothetical protein
VPNNLTWVPASHPFINVLNLFLVFRRANSDRVIERDDFVDWLVNDHRFKRNTAIDYCFPLGPNEFGLWDRTIEDLEVIVQGGVEALSLVLQNQHVDEDKRAWVCLNDARIVGEIRALNLTKDEIVRHIIQYRFAGTESAANTLIYVGNQVGKHFGLLDDNGQPTPLFNALCKIGEVWR